MEHYWSKTLDDAENDDTDALESFARDGGKYAHKYDPSKDKSSSKKPNNYILIDSAGYRLGPQFSSTSPYSAALKAASRGYTDFSLYAPHSGKVHNYCGCMRDIADSEHTNYTAQYGITQKPMVKSLGAYKHTDSATPKAPRW